MKTIQTKPDCTLGFVKLEHLHLYMQFPEGADNTWMPPIVIGKLSEITEEQAQEVVDLGKLTFEIATPESFDGKKQKRYVDLNEWYDLRKFEGTKMEEVYKYTLKKAAQSLGIEEKDFDKYLVIKL